jgi:hypothetical protein
VIYRRGPWRSFEAVEMAMLEWVAWFNNRRLLEPIGYLPTAEYEAAYPMAMRHLPENFHCFINNVAHNVGGRFDFIDVRAGFATPERSIFEVAGVLGCHQRGVVARHLHGATAMSIHRSNDRALARPLSDRRPPGQFPLHHNLVSDYSMRRVGSEAAVKEIEVRGIFSSCFDNSILVLLRGERLVCRHKPSPDRNPLTAEHEGSRGAASCGDAARCKDWHLFHSVYDRG